MKIDDLKEKIESYIPGYNDYQSDDLFLMENEIKSLKWVLGREKEEGNAD